MKKIRCFTKYTARTNPKNVAYVDEKFSGERISGRVSYYGQQVFFTPLQLKLELPTYGPDRHNRKKKIFKPRSK